MVHASQTLAKSAAVVYYPAMDDLLEQQYLQSLRRLPSDSDEAQPMADPMAHRPAPPLAEGVDGEGE
jgi:hypothetical protein